MTLSTTSHVGLANAQSAIVQNCAGFAAWLVQHDACKRSLSKTKFSMVVELWGCKFLPRFSTCALQLSTTSTMALPS